MKKTIFILLALSFCYSCNKKEPEQLEKIQLTEAEVVRIWNVNDKVFSLFEKDIKKSTDKNIILSPISLGTFVAMSNNNYYPSKNETKEDNNLFTKIVKEHSKVNVGRLSNAVIFNENARSIDNFKNTLAKNYKADVFKMDFKNTKNVKSKLETWVAEKTENTIRSLPIEINATDKWWLVNAMYFKGLWKNPFDTKNTNNGEFNNIDASKSKVDMMHLKLYTRYFKGDLFSAIILPFRNDYNMTVILADSEDFILDGKIFKSIRKMSSVTEVNLTLPKFKTKYDEKVNLTTLGGENSAIHVSYISVDEQGAVASSVSIGKDIMDIPPKKVDFIVNRPFFFVISSDDGNQILQIGKIVKL